MANLSKLFVEMVLVGLALVVVSLTISYIENRNVLRAPHIKSMVIGVFLSGATLHFLFEVAGLNEWYVKQYTPLLRYGGVRNHYQSKLGGMQAK